MYRSQRLFLILWRNLKPRTTLTSLPLRIILCNTSICIPCNIHKCAFVEFEIISSNQYSRPAGDMELSSEVQISSRPREASNVMKQRILSPQGIQSHEAQDKHNIRTSIGQSYLGENYEKSRIEGDVCISLPKSSKNSQKPLVEGKANKNDELIKHMLNLPGYLQRVEKGVNLQEKAFNFGVLDWDRLEKWKHVKPTQPICTASASSTGSSSSCKVDGQLSHSSTVQSKSLNPSQRQGFSHDVKRSLIQENCKAASRNMLDGQQNSARINTFSGRNKFEGEKKEGSDQKIRSKKGTTLSDLRKQEFSRSSKVEIVSQRNIANREEELQKRHGEHRNIHLLPSRFPKESCSANVQISDPGNSFDAKQMETYQERYSDWFPSEDVPSAEQDSEILHSCQLPIGVKKNTDETPTILSYGKCINKNALRMQPSSENGIDASKRLDHETAIEPAAVKGRHLSPNRFSLGLSRISRSLSFKESSNVPRLSSTFANLKSGSVDACPIPVVIETNTESDWRRHRLTSAQKMELSRDDSPMFISLNETPRKSSREISIKISKQYRPETTEVVKGRNPSPNRRLNFGLDRMSQSFSSKESSTVPQLSSSYATLKSVPVRSETYDSLDSANRNNTVHNRVSSSPLRRLLDPLFKGRKTNPPHSVEISPALTGNNATSTVQAFLQLIIKNGLPLFKLVANNGEILVALNNLTAHGKDDAGWMFTFYSVCKKKSGSWISQQHKRKNQGFGYNAIGQMKVYSSLCPDLTVQNYNEKFSVRESVLYSIEHRQGQQSPKLVERELAAIVVKIPAANSDNDGGQRNKGQETVRKRFNRTTVVLPDGVHGFPNKGVPSPLIEIWKSGGSCDCGGWDVGCKLRILTNEDQSCNLMEPSVSNSSPDQFDLFKQGGNSDCGPIFSMKPFEKGIYSVQFSTSISLLQAFSICVEFVSNQNSFDFLEVSEAELLQETTLPERARMKDATKYVPPPPLSPVGRA